MSVVINGTSGITSPGGDVSTSLSTGAVTSSGASTVGSLVVAGNNVSAANSLGFRNRIINGDMRIDQRNAGASVTVPNASSIYTLDRWVFSTTQGSKLSTQQTPSATESGYEVRVSAGFTGYLSMTSLSAYSLLSTDYFLLEQRIEGYNVSDLAWGSANAQPITVSFWVRSSLTGLFNGGIRLSGTATYLFTYSVSSANVWEYKTVTIPGYTGATSASITNATRIVLRFNLGSGSAQIGTAGTWGSSDYTASAGTVNIVANNAATLNITGVQLEAGSVATPFERRAYGTELALCQRYYWQSDTISSGSLLIDSYSNVAGAQLVSCIIASLPVSMRSTPTIAVPAGSVLNITSNSWALRGGVIFATGSYSGAGRAYYQTSANGVISAVSEL